MLNTMLLLEPSNPDSEEPTNQNLYYIRTFVFEVDDLKQVLCKMMDDGYDNNGKAYIWLERIEEENGNSPVTIRYCGQSKNKPWDRHVSDIYSTSLKTYFGRFLKTTSEWCQDVLVNATVQVVSRFTSRCLMLRGLTIL
jgi:hypothetical protein